MALVFKSQGFSRKSQFDLMTGYKYSLRKVHGQEILFRNVSGVFSAENEIAMLQDALDNSLIEEKVIGMVING